MTIQPEKFRKKPVVISAMRWDGTAESATPSKRSKRATMSIFQFSA